MTIIDAITSSPLNVFFTLFIGIGLAYLYYRKPPSSSSSTSTSTTATTTNTSSSATLTHHHLSRALSSAYRTSPGAIDTAGVVDEELQRAIAQIERQERDMIRKEQDEAYQKSLKADREKKLKREEELKAKEAKEREEREKAEQAERLHQQLTKLKIEIRDRIQAIKKVDNVNNDNDDEFKLVFKLPNSTRVQRNFFKTDKVKLIYWFVFSLDEAPLKFKLTTNFPKRDLPGRPPLPVDFVENSSCSSSSNNNTASSSACEQTLEEIGITETQIIFVNAETT